MIATLNELSARAHELERQIVPAAARVAGGPGLPGQRRRAGAPAMTGYVPLASVRAAVCAEWQHDLRELMSRSRGARTAEPRHAAFLLARDVTPMSFPEIGRAFYRDHTSVLHGVRRCAERMRADLVSANARHRARPRRPRFRAGRGRAGDDRLPELLIDGTMIRLGAPAGFAPWPRTIRSRCCAGSPPYARTDAMSASPTAVVPDAWFVEYYRERRRKALFVMFLPTLGIWPGIDFGR